MVSLQGLVISITGAASGIGLEIARLAASRGAKLSLADIQEDKLKEVVSELRALNTEVIGTRVNVASNQEVDDWVTATMKHFGRLDGAANIAGVASNGKTSKFVDMSNEDWDAVLGINLTGLMYCNRAQLRVMKKGASIVNCASVVGLMGQPNLCAYSVSKHGVIGLTKTVAKEVAGMGIRVNAVAP
jgi:NAD(P)-dependent dehydrogenase (short-subunit alcohol dehydrogenase family)